jgi:2-C-methyl-D-erythritol 2,4-cyclodiphosphate synthase
MTHCIFRIGQGYDVHRLVPGRDLILGGVKIPHTLGLDGHSDADALIHAVIDALYGAAGLGDIGRHFPDTSPKYKNADSRILLKECVRELNEAGWEIVNVDSTVIAQKPKLSPHIEDICSSLAAVLGIDRTAVNVKAKTNERLGFEGQEQGIQTQAVALISRIPNKV